MFVTYRTTENKKASRINPNLQVWPVVELVIQKAICLITFQARGKGDDDRLTRSMLVGDPSEFETVLPSLGRLNVCSTCHTSAGTRMARKNMVSAMKWKGFIVTRMYPESAWSRLRLNA